MASYPENDTDLSSEIGAANRALRHFRAFATTMWIADFQIYNRKSASMTNSIFVRPHCSASSANGWLELLRTLLKL